MVSSLAGTEPRPVSVSATRGGDRQQHLPPSLPPPEPGILSVPPSTQFCPLHALPLPLKASLLSSGATYHWVFVSHVLPLVLHTPHLRRNVLRHFCYSHQGSMQAASTAQHRVILPIGSKSIRLTDTLTFSFPAFPSLHFPLLPLFFLVFLSRLQAFRGRGQSSHSF